MLASDPSSVLRPKASVPDPNPTRSLFTARFCFGPRSWSRTSFAMGPKLSVNSVEMELLRRIGRGCFRNPRLKVEADSGGEDFFDAAAAMAKPVPSHLVIMVNDTIESASDWRYAVEQFVKKLLDKVVVHHKRSYYLEN
ncbi:hypothetical protein TanjilG_14834 [Lupinus angustifolius]|uniref:Uncharacterized protein n=1 Tax=Lupinus angustifolius TaxID=3871 RepID=A0A1J7GD30_LUPAN|nr:hypothetical protein TanjilG_14834 [Lupinus angustifolius]